MATAAGCPVSHRVDDLLGGSFDLGVVVAFGRIIKPHVLDHLEMVNLHFSLLPRWRGAAPVERAILAGDDTTGVCLMAVEEGLDTGGVYRRVKTPINAHETAADLTARLGEMGSALLIDALRTGLGEPDPQRGEPTYAEKITSDDLALTWTQPADHLHRILRVGPGWTSFRGQRFLVLSAEVTDAGPPPGRLDGLVVGCGDGRGLRLVTVKPAGKPAMDAASWRNGARPDPDERLGG